MRPLPQDTIAPLTEVRPPRLLPPAARPVPVLITSPHSGTDYIPDLLAQTRLPLARLRASEDSLVDQLVAGVPQLGATVLCANIPRVFCDLNRGPWELDPAMFVETLPGYCDTASPRIGQGYGTIARFAAAGDHIYGHRLPFSEAQHRIAAYWQPFHHTLRVTIESLQARFGACLLLDCHSMPRSHATDPDLVFGDAFGTSAAPALLRVAESVAAEAGLRTIRNQPYAGGYITRHYGRPEANIHAIQIEIARPLYLQRGTYQAGRGFSRIRSLIEALVARMIAEMRA